MDVLGKIPNARVFREALPLPEPVVRVKAPPAVEVAPILDELPLDVRLDRPRATARPDRPPGARSGEAALLRADHGEAKPALVQLELPLAGTGAPAPASAGASASASASPGGSVGVGFVALAALLTLLVCARSARIRLALAAWQPTYLLSLPERPG
jgi:hypothetical protein